MRSRYLDPQSLPGLLYAMLVYWHVNLWSWRLIAAVACSEGSIVTWVTSGILYRPKSLVIGRYLAQVRFALYWVFSIGEGPNLLPTNYVAVNYGILYVGLG